MTFRSVDKWTSESSAKKSAQNLGAASSIRVAQFAQSFSFGENFALSVRDRKDAFRRVVLAHVFDGPFCN
jgi:hypothetical protein